MLRIEGRVDPEVVVDLGRDTGDFGKALFFRLLGLARVRDEYGRASSILGVMCAARFAIVDVVLSKSYHLLFVSLADRSKLDRRS